MTVQTVYVTSGRGQSQDDVILFVLNYEGGSLLSKVVAVVVVVVAVVVAVVSVVRVAVFVVVVAVVVTFRQCARNDPKQRLAAPICTWPVT